MFKNGKFYHCKWYHPMIFIHVSKFFTLDTICSTKNGYIISGCAKQNETVFTLHFFFLGIAKKINFCSFFESAFLRFFYDSFMNSSAMDFKQKILNNFTVEKQQHYVEIFVLQDYSVNSIHHNV